MTRTRKNLLMALSMFGLAAMPAAGADFGDPSQTGRLPLVAGSVDAEAQVAPQPAEAAALKFSQEQLKQLVGPIALYPDPLLAHVLAGATYPLEIVQASRFVKANAKDPALADKIAAQRWDPSVQALAHYPGVLAMMDENLEWTQNLGAAFLYQQEDVMAAVQVCRAQAQAAGNLATTEQQKVVVEERIIQIVPADPQIIYVPVYEPEYVYVERPVYHHAPLITFGSACHVGSWLHLDFDWHRHRVCYGGWYDRHHSHRHHGHNDHKHRGSDRRDDDKHDAHNHRGDGRDDDRGFRGTWQRDVTRAGPQVRPAVHEGVQRTQVNGGSERSTRSDRGDRVVNGSDRTGDRPDRAVTTDGDRSRHGFRPLAPIGGNVRTMPGFSRPTGSAPGTTDRGRAVPGPVSESNDRPARGDGDGRRGDDRRSEADRPRTPAAPPAAVRTEAPGVEPVRPDRVIKPIETPRAVPPRLDTPNVTPDRSREKPAETPRSITPRSAPPTIPQFRPNPVPSAPAAPAVQAPRADAPRSRPQERPRSNPIESPRMDGPRARPVETPRVDPPRAQTPRSEPRVAPTPAPTNVVRPATTPGPRTITQGAGNPKPPSARQADRVAPSRVVTPQSAPSPSVAAPRASTPKAPPPAVRSAPPGQATPPAASSSRPERPSKPEPRADSPSKGGDSPRRSR